MTRSEEAAAISDFLAAAATGPAALVVEGEPGIGKTKLWSETVDQAIEHGFHVLSACPGEAESVYGYASLADLLAGVDAAVFAVLPKPQRLALDGFRLRTEADDQAVDQRAIGAAFLTVIETLAQTRPVLIALDDLQWVDLSSANAIAFAARRLKARVGVLGTARSGPSNGGAPSWLQMPEPDAVRRIQLRPLSLGRLQAVLQERLGTRFTRPTMVKIFDISGGNPFYALELARAMDPRAQSSDVPMPRSLTELVRARISNLPAEARQLLLTAACLAAPTVETVALAAHTDPGDVIERLADAEEDGLVEIEHNRLRFAHPVLARGVYCSASPAQRREAHRRLAEVVRDPELMARHRALAATRADPETLQTLDEAAELARVRGAPMAAAELLELAIGLGGGTAQRRIQLADYHFAAGNAGRARALLQETIDQPIPRTLRARALGLLGVIAVLDDGPAGAEALLERALHEAPTDPEWRAQTLRTLSFAQAKTGHIEAALATIEDAVAEATNLGPSHLLGSTLGTRAMFRFMSGAGVDKSGLRQALELEDREANTPLIFRPSLVNAVLLGYSGELDRAHNEMLEVRRRCSERGEESELAVIGFTDVMIEIWRGNFAEAALCSEDVWERALALDGAFPKFMAHTSRAVLAAYIGRVDEARRHVADALATAQGADYFAVAWPTTTLGFLEVSLGNYDAALTTLRPLLSKFEGLPRGLETIAASCVPDAIEAMIELGQLREAEPFIEMLESEGRRLDRPWQLAVGARCRGMLLAARGDINAADVAIQRALAEHQRLPMPFEHARTQLLMGQIQHRQHQKVASTTLKEALRTFEELNAPLWANRAGKLLDQTSIAPIRSAILSPTERRVAELAATGLTNREVAAALSISPKTVEANLSRVYHKLDIRSRAELGQHMSQTEG
ncbi:ATP-binding protein [Mycobacterium sp.]|uniref:ATP-binding protein n=1 Tax=Mycobacterium sp. TaxID=1785 RepID=UPI002D9DF40D|nr:AAA family ATPase [Mycobacterium sp.]